MRLLVIAALFKVVAAYPPSPLFRLTSAGEQCSDIGYVRLSDVSECQQAAMYVSFSDTTVDAGEETNAALPYGCIVDSTNALRLISDSGNNPATEGSTRQLCKEVLSSRLAPDMCGGPANREEPWSTPGVCYDSSNSANKAGVRCIGRGKIGCDDRGCRDSDTNSYRQDTFTHSSGTVFDWGSLPVDTKCYSPYRLGSQSPALDTSIGPYSSSCDGNGATSTQGMRIEPVTNGFCAKSSTYTEALIECDKLVDFEGNTMRVPTVAELSLCCGGGGGLDGVRIWSCDVRA